MPSPASSVLTSLEQGFVAHFVRSWDARAAALAAGYAPARLARTVTTLLQHEPVLAAIRQQATAGQLAREEALVRLSQLARGTVEPFLQRTTDGRVVVDLASTEAQQHYPLLKGVTQQRYTMATPEGEVEVVETGIELHCPLEALTQLLHLHGAYPPRRVEHTSAPKPTPKQP